MVRRLPSLSFRCCRVMFTSSICFSRPVAERKFPCLLALILVLSFLLFNWSQQSTWQSSHVDEPNEALPHFEQTEALPDFGKLGFGPYPVTHIANLFIPMPDGVRVALALWLPSDDLSSAPFIMDSKWAELIYPGAAEVRPTGKTFGTILEYIPYCKDYSTLDRDHARHTWWASHGFVAIHADIRGTGASEGFYYDEYTQQEFDDGADIIAWITAQPWSNGRVGLYGKSWGGFNGLQIAAEQPPGLVTAISLYSTDDRYTDDVHYMGGAVVGTGMVSWANVMFYFNARAPPVQYFDDHELWKKAWKERLEKSGASWLPIWLKHQIRTDPYWAHGSINEDMSQVKIPILAIGGLADGYTNAVLRMADWGGPNGTGGLNRESKMIIGPWSHAWPDVAMPGPRIDYVGECLRWWNAHLKTPEDEPNLARDDALNLPRLRLFVRDPYEPAQFVDTVPGRWVNLPRWPKRSEVYKHVVEEQGEDDEESPFVHTFYFGANRLLVTEPVDGEILDIKPNKFQGINSGNWLALGNGIDLPADQTIPNEKALSFTTPPLEEDLSLSGFSTALLAVRAETEGRYNLAVRLSHQDSSGLSLRVSYGVLNLAQWEGDRKPKKTFPANQTIVVPVELNVAGCRIPKGHKLVVSISPVYAPTLYPATHIHGLSLDTGGSHFIVQSLPAKAFRNKPVFDPPRPLLTLLSLRKMKAEKENSYKEGPDGSVTFRLLDDSGATYYPHLGLTMREREEDLVKVSNDMTETYTVSRRECTYTYDKPALNWTVLAVSEMTTVGEGDFQVNERLDVKINGEPFFDKIYESVVPRVWV